MWPGHCRPRVSRPVTSWRYPRWPARPPHFTGVRPTPACCLPQPAACRSLLPSGQPVRIVFWPCSDTECLKVKSTCLPCVLCEQADGTWRVHDVRQVQGVRLDPDFARSARKARRIAERASHGKRRERKRKQMSGLAGRNENRSAGRFFKRRFGLIGRCGPGPGIESARSRFPGRRGRNRRRPVVRHLA